MEKYNGGECKKGCNCLEIAEQKNSGCPVKEYPCLQPNDDYSQKVDKKNNLHKSVKERDTLDLLELVCQLHSRALAYPSEEMHDAYVEARTEMELRLKNIFTTNAVTKTKEEILGKYTQAQSEFDSVIKYTLGDALKAMEEYLQSNLPTQSFSEEEMMEFINKHIIKITNEYGVTDKYILPSEVRSFLIKFISPKSEVKQ